MAVEVPTGSGVHVGDAREQLKAVMLDHFEPSVVTIGSFDGVHRGHTALVEATRRLARDRGLEAIAVTFSPRPEALFSPTPLPDICTLPERVERLLSAGADRVVVLPFDRAVATIGFEDFAALLAHNLGMQALFVGEDFALGRGRLGTPERLRALGLEVHEQKLIPNRAGTAKASSSSIRRALAVGIPRALALSAE